MSSEMLGEIKEELKDSNTIKVAINGFGRIGRMIFRAAFDDPKVEIVAINDLGDISHAAYYLEFDSAQGRFEKKVDYNDNNLIIGDKKIAYHSYKDPNELPWSDYDVDVVAECTGIFKDTQQARVHIERGAKKVLISAPGKGDCFYLVRGVNDSDYNGEEIVSNGSCTTNSMTAIIDKLNKNYGIKKGMFSTVHSMTGDQKIVDSNHKDLRRGRAGPFNIVPTTTGAAGAVIRLIPELEGRLHGIAYRVPTITGSVTDLNLELEKDVSKEEINEFLKDLSQDELNGIIEYSDRELVSTDIIGNSHSGIVDSLSTEVVSGNFVKLVVWYDNEWGFSNRMVEVMKKISN